jgi:hypothetical protein
MNVIYIYFTKIIIYILEARILPTRKWVVYIYDIRDAISLPYQVAMFGWSLAVGSISAIFVQFILRSCAATRRFDWRIDSGITNFQVIWLRLLYEDLFSLYIHFHNIITWSLSG